MFAKSVFWNILQTRHRFQLQNILDLSYKVLDIKVTQPAFTCSKLTIKTLEQGVKYVQS